LATARGAWWYLGFYSLQYSWGLDVTADTKDW